MMTLNFFQFASTTTFCFLLISICSFADCRTIHVVEKEMGVDETEKRHLAEKATKTPKAASTKAPVKASKSTKAPTPAPTSSRMPSMIPSHSPSNMPSVSPSRAPSSVPSVSSSPSSVPSSSPSVCTSDPRSAAEIRDILLDVTDASVLDEAGTPQNEAYLWLVNEDTYISPCPDDLIQRFVLSTLYYSLEIENSPGLAPTWLDTSKDECEWGSVTCMGGAGGSVTLLSLASNSLAGSIPPELGQLSWLVYLYLESNSITGTLPTELGQLEYLKFFRAYSNSLTGSLPSELGNLSSLEDLILYSNSLTGTIPSDFGNLVELYQLSLFSNALTGTIPTELGKMAALRELRLNDNSLDGAIPTELGNNARLQNLILDSNSLTSTVVPGEVCSLPVLGSISTDWCGSKASCCTR